MEHREYLEHYLTPHADGELAEPESALADEHIANCAACHERFESERDLKLRLRRCISLAQTPPELRARLLEALDRMATAPTRGAHAPAWIARLMRPLYLFPTAAAALALIAVLVWTRTRTPDYPPFDEAIAQFEKFQQGFTPNLPSGSIATLVGEYARQVDYPVYVWNFSSAGIELVGGRIEHANDGRTMLYTFYKGKSGEVLCVRYRSSNASLPRGGRELNQLHHFYRYHGYALCLTFYGGAACILVTQLPLARFIDDIHKIEE